MRRIQARFLRGDDVKYIAIFAMILAFIAFGCISSEQVFQDTGARGLETAPSAPAVDSGNQIITKESSMTIKVQEGTLQSKFDEMRSMLESNGAELSDIRYYELSDRRQYLVTVKVSPVKFDTINEQLRQIGEVKDISVSLEDVTQQYTDLDTRISNREVELERLHALYNQTSNISELLEVEREITRVETELELLKQQKQYLVSRIERSSISITLYEDKPATSQLSLSLESLGVLFFGMVAAAITVIVAIAGFVLPIAAAVGVLWFIYKRLKGGGKQKPKPRKQEFSQIPPER